MIQAITEDPELVMTDALKEAVNELRSKLSAGASLRLREPMSKRTTLRVGGCADVFLEPDGEEDLLLALRLCHERDIPALVVGRGSNLLVRDGGIRGMTISLARPVFCHIEAGGMRLRCGAGARLKAIAVAAKQHEIGGLEFLEGIPGTVGGALRMNAGAMGGVMFGLVERVRFTDPRGVVSERPGSEFSPEYRRCEFFKHHIALAAWLEGAPAPRAEIEERMRQCARKRWDSQPAMPSAGCTFKNSETVAAGRLVEELGLKGKAIGGAVISEAHGNFIVNQGDARASDVLALIELVKREAWARRGIELETEVEIVGEDRDPEEGI